jgi:cysteinyl-tRNA synthetase, unknown class
MKNFFPKMIVLFLLIITAGCSSGGNNLVRPPVPPVDSPTPSPVQLNPVPLKQVKYWAVQLVGIEKQGMVEKLESSSYELLVVEPTRTNWADPDARDFDTEAMVRKLKNSKVSDGTHRKMVFAYLSIGAAETWRWYWKWSKDIPEGGSSPPDWPDFILGRDPNCWEGNYIVAFWDPRWKDIMITGQNQDSSPYGNYHSAIDQVLKDGFDGVYLDWTSAYSVDIVKTRAEKDGVNAAEEMVKFIREIREYAHARNPRFIILQANGFDLHRLQPEVFNVVDAISQQSIWYYGTAHNDWNSPEAADFRNNQDLTDYYLVHLREWKNAGFPVFNLEYAVVHADDAYKKSKAEGFIPYCSRRALSHLTTTPPE